MSEKQSKRLRAVERHMVDLARCQKLQAETTTKLAASVAQLEQQDGGSLRAVRERNETRAESRRAAEAVTAWRHLTYAILVLSILVLIAAIMALQEPPQAQAAEPEPTAAVEILEDQEESQHIEDAILARAHLLGETTVTHYCICEKCCGKQPDDPAYGITASGRRATPGVSVAVDTALIPLGATVLADYGDGVLHYYRADDTGAAIKGNHIDLCMADHQSAINAGVRHATVWWAEEG